MAFYSWRVGSVALGSAASWDDTTTGADPALTPPGVDDTAYFGPVFGGGGTISGDGSVFEIQIAAGATSPWIFTGALTAQSASVESATSLASGAMLTLTGEPSLTASFGPVAGTINAAFTLVDATLDSAGGALTVGGNYLTQAAGGNLLAVTAGSTATAMRVTVGSGTTGSITVTGTGSSLTTAASAAFPTTGYLSLGDAGIFNGITTPGFGTLTVADGGLVTIGQNLNIGEDAGSTGTITIESGGHFTFESGYAELGNLAGSTGSMTIESGGVFTLAGGQLLVGNQAGATGTLTINAGGQFVAIEAAQTANYLLSIGAGAAVTGEAAAMGTVTVQGQGALLDLGSNPLAVGHGGTGVLNVLGGAVVKAESIDSTSDVTSIASLSIGRFGTGTVNVTGAGSMLSLIGTAYAGRGASGSGTINVTAAGLFQVSLDATGTGNISIGAGGGTTGQQVPGGTGTLGVNTAGTVTAAGDFSVGVNGGVGTAVLASGGSVTASGLIQIGTGTAFAGANGSVLIESGAGLHSNGPHQTGTGSISIAGSAMTVGKVTVTGAGSVLDAGGDRISVGSRGQGTLLIAAGATASAGSTLYSDAASESGFSVGSTSTGSGTATVDGAGSGLSVDGAITLAGGLTGAGGTGSLTASGGGSVTATGLVLWSGGSLDADGASLVEIGHGAASGGGVAIMAGSRLTAHGGAITAAVSNEGVLSNDGTLTVAGDVTGAGTLELLAGSSTAISGSLAGQSVVFAGASGVLDLAGVSGSVDVSAQAGDLVDLRGITGVTTDGTTVTTSSGALHFTSLAAGAHVVLGSDGQGGMQASIACYCPGTAILTVRGEVPVERLAIGDRVMTMDGRAEPVRWIGRRSYGGAFVAGNHLMLPVCIKAGALADGVPRRDLHVSPGHALFVDGQLVPAWRLINGVSVVQAEAVDGVEYLHVELGAHAVILADGAPAESFLDDGCRGQFQNAGEFDRLYPCAAPAVALQPRLEDGFALQAVQDRVAARAAVIGAAEPIGALVGFIDSVAAGRVAGWAQDSGSPEEPVALEILVGGVGVVCALANAYRADLRRAGVGSGCHAFDVMLPGGWAGQVTVRRIADGAALARAEGAADGVAAGAARLAA